MSGSAAREAETAKPLMKVSGKPASSIRRADTRRSSRAWTRQARRGEQRAQRIDGRGERRRGRCGRVYPSASGHGERRRTQHRQPLDAPIGKDPQPLPTEQGAERQPRPRDVGPQRRIQVGQPLAQARHQLLGRGEREAGAGQLRDHAPLRSARRLLSLSFTAGRSPPTSMPRSMARVIFASTSASEASSLAGAEVSMRFRSSSSATSGAVLHDLLAERAAHGLQHDAFEPSLADAQAVVAVATVAVRPAAPARARQRVERAAALATGEQACQQPRAPSPTAHGRAHDPALLVADVPGAASLAGGLRGLPQLVGHDAQRLVRWRTHSPRVARSGGAARLVVLDPLRAVEDPRSPR